MRFETPDSELALDLAAVNDDGQVLLLGVARAEPLELAKLEALVPTFEGEGSVRSMRESRVGRRSCSPTSCGAPVRRTSGWSRPAPGGCSGCGTAAPSS